MNILNIFKKNQKQQRNDASPNISSEQHDSNSSLEVNSIFPRQKIKKDFVLDVSSLKNIPFNKYKNDFTFVVNGKKYQTSRFLADILSPYIRQYHYTDETLTKFTLKLDDYDDQNSTDYFSEFLQLLNFEDSNKLDKKRLQYYSEFFYLLGNIDEFFRLQPNIFSNITIENVIDQLLTISDKPLIFDNYSEPVKYLITFAAHHFEEIDKSRLKTLNIEILNEIFSNSSLQLASEDSLFNFLIDLYQKDSKYSILFEHVIFNNLTDESLFHFTNTIELSDINNDLWHSICYRLLPTKIESFKFYSKGTIDTMSKSSQRYIFETIEFERSNDEEFDGIMHFLTNLTRGNIHDNGTIEISSNSISTSDNTERHPKFLVDYQSNSYYFSKDNGDAFICFDFKNQFVKLSSYSIKNNKSSNLAYLKNWVVEVSNNGVEWVVIDRRMDDRTLKGPFLVANFKINGQESDNSFYRFIRLRQTGNSWCDYNKHNHISAMFIEFYGKIKLKPDLVH